ncbi:MAG: hypothetical protein AAGA30_14480, partial [Planctomycetota bacterium]
MNKTFSGLLLIIVAAAAGLGLMVLPSWLIDKYETAKSLGDFWGWLYLFVVGSGALLVLSSFGWTVWKLWGASHFKKLRRSRRSKNPSELSASQREAEYSENLDQIRDLKHRTGEIDSSTEQDFKGQLDPLLRELEYKRECQELEIVAFGTISSGKSS